MCTCLTLELCLTYFQTKALKKHICERTAQRLEAYSLITDGNPPLHFEVKLRPPLKFTFWSPAPHFPLISSPAFENALNACIQFYLIELVYFCKRPVCLFIETRAGIDNRFNIRVTLEVKVPFKTGYKTRSAVQDSHVKKQDNSKML